MDKIKIFLVEDEIVIRNGIRNGIEWEKEGHEFVGEASDGELAYPMILEAKPDILITDIRMPFMDGLELCRLVREELPDIKILILSGYDEFDYAKEAIRLGVTEYLLKPITSAKLLEVLEKIGAQVRHENAERELLRKYTEDMKENAELEKMMFFVKLVSGEMSIGDIIDTGKRFDMNLSARAYSVVLFKIVYQMKERKRLPHAAAVYSDVEEMIAKLPNIQSFQRGVDGWAFLLTADSKEQMAERIGRLKQRLKSLMDEYEDAEYFGGIGKCVTRLGEIRESFIEADRAFAGRFTHEMNQIISAKELRELHEEEELNLRGFSEIGHSRQLIEKFLNNGTDEEIESFSRAYLEEIPEDNLRSTIMRQYIMMDIYIVVMSFCEKLEVSEELLHKEMENAKTAMKTAYSEEEIHRYITMLLKKAVEFRDTASGRRYSDIIQAAKEEIAATYMSEDISLNVVAASIGMSPSYFSSIFSREVGKTFVEYLTETRMEKAKELLMCSPMKTSEIGYEVGYKDSHYFSYIFKKTQGCSPKEYRARRKE